MCGMRRVSAEPRKQGVSNTTEGFDTSSQKKRNVCLAPAGGGGASR